MFLTWQPVHIKNKISSGSVEIGHLNSVEASAARVASGSLETADLLAVYDKSANAMKAVSLEHLEAFMSASNPTHFTASGDVILGTPGDSDDIAIYNQFISSLIPKPTTQMILQGYNQGKRM